MLNNNANAVSVLDFQNENQFDSFYPFSPYQGSHLSRVFTAASLIQLDGFVPVLQSVFVEVDRMTFTIKIDREILTVVVNRNTFAVGQSIVLRTSGNNVFVGELICGDGFETLWNSAVPFLYNTPASFAPQVIRSIPSKSGVYEINGKIGDIVFESNNNVFFEQAGQEITCNAVSYPDQTNGVFLKTLNSIPPINSQIYLNDSELVRINEETFKLIFSLPGIEIKPKLIQ